MRISMQFCILAALTWFSATQVMGAKYLTEQPSFLVSCKRSDPGFGNCFAKNLERTFFEWRAGVPGLKSIRSLDPLHFKRVKITQGSQSGPISMNMDLVNATLSGLGGTIIDALESNAYTLDFKLKIAIPSFKMAGDYTMQGNILSLALNSHGKALMTFDNAVIEVDLQFRIHERDGVEFADVEKCHLEWTENGGMKFHLENLFNGDKALEDGAHYLLNDNWRVIFDVLRPSLSQANEVVVTDIIVKLFGYVPAKYVIE
ncbi:protein takeout-like [Musca autumnalis]|uniref:protein takeout-like n=1 Tax=Musca autumnalis TaxID=221902 RepID=UPI003CFB02EB